MDYLVEQLRYQLREDPASRAFFKLGEHLRREGELDEAVEVLKAGLEHHPRYVAAWVSLGRALLGRGDSAAAADALAKAVELDPENAVAARHAGEAAIANGDWITAIKSLKRARALSGADEALDGRILMVEERLAENGMLEVPAPEPRRPPPAAPPEPEPEPESEGEAADDGVFPVDEASGEAAGFADDVFAAAEEPSGDAGAPDDEMSRKTMAISYADVMAAVSTPPPAPPGRAEADAGAVFDLGAEEPSEPEPEPVLGTDREPVFEAEAEPAFEPEPEALFEAEPEPVAAGEVDEGSVLAPSTDVAEAAPEPAPEAPFEAPVAAADAAEADEEDGDTDWEPAGEDVFATTPRPLPALDAKTRELWEEASEEAGEPEEPFEADDDRRSEELPLPTMTLARLALEQGDLELAEKTLRGVLVRNPEHGEAAALLASLGAGAAPEPPQSAARSQQARLEALRRWLEAVRLASERPQS